MNLSCKILKKLQICASPSASSICSMGIKRSNRNKCLNCKYYIPKIAHEGFMQGFTQGLKYKIPYEWDFEKGASE